MGGADYRGNRSWIRRPSHSRLASPGRRSMGMGLRAGLECIHRSSVSDGSAALSRSFVFAVPDNLHSFGTARYKRDRSVVRTRHPRRAGGRAFAGSAFDACCLRNDLHAGTTLRRRRGCVVNRLTRVPVRRPALALGLRVPVDMPALAFELTALWVFQAGYGFTAVVLCVLAFFSKQSSIAAIGAITLFSWLDGKRGQAVALAGFWLAAVGLLTLLAQWLWPFYLTNTVGAVSADYLDSRAALVFLEGMVGCDIAISILGLLALRHRRVNRLALLFLLTALLENIVSSLRWGSYIYYFLPTLAALTIVAAPQMDALLEDFAKLGRLGQVACGLIVALIIPLGNVGIHSPLDWIRLADRYRPPWDLASLHRLRSIRGLVLTDRGVVTLVDNSPRLKAVDLALVGVMRRNREFNDKRLLTAIRCREFSAIALGRNGLDLHFRGRMFLWRQLREAIRANYAPLASSGPPFLMLPRAGRGCINHETMANRSDSVSGARQSLQWHHTSVDH